MDVEPKIGGFTPQIIHFNLIKNRGFYPPNHPFVHRGFPYFHHPFWGKTHYLETPKYMFIPFFIYTHTLHRFYGLHYVMLIRHPWRGRSGSMQNTHRIHAPDFPFRWVTKKQQKTYTKKNTTSSFGRCRIRSLFFLPRHLKIFPSVSQGLYLVHWRARILKMRWNCEYQKVHPQTKCRTSRRAPVQRQQGGPLVGWLGYIGD